MRRHLPLFVGLLCLALSGPVAHPTALPHRDGHRGALEGQRWLRPTDDAAEDAFTVPEQDRHHVDTTHFRIHFTDVGVDAATPAFVKEVAGVFEEVWRTEVTALGWPAPVPDDGLGGSELVDVYLVDLDDGPYGYAAADEANPCTACRSVFGYLVVENDFVGYEPNPHAALRSTAAHEFAHLLQMGMAWDAEPWAYEATAVWLEREVYPLEDARTIYLQDFASRPELSLTDFSERRGGFDRAYGAYVWNVYLAELHGPALVRRAWELAAADDAHVLSGFAGALGEVGVSLDEAFTAFTAATAGWEVGGFPGEPQAYPTVTRSGVLASGDAVTVEVDHAAAHIVDLDVGSSVTVIVRAPRHVAGGVAVVASGGGEVLTAIDHTLFDGEATVTLSGIGEAGRVSLAVVNADAALARPKRLGVDRTTYLRDDVPIRIGVDVDPGAPPKS